MALLNEKLICISEQLSDVMMFEPRYYLDGISGAIPSVYVRETVCDMLAQAVSKLPSNYKFKVFDAWRPVAVQKALFEKHLVQLRQIFPGVCDTDLWSKALEFVSYPSCDEKAPFVHATGGAIDLTIVDAMGNNLNMGTEFDDFTELAHTHSFDKSENYEIRNNRQLLLDVMTSVGFTNFKSEWWHYDFGDQFWSDVTGKPVIYYGIYQNMQ